MGFEPQIPRLFTLKRIKIMIKPENKTKIIIKESKYKIEERRDL